MTKQNSANGAAGAWLTKSEALRALAVSERSLDRMVTAGKVEKTTRPRPGRTPEPIYKRSDIERLTTREAFLVPSPTAAESAAAPSAPQAPPQQFPAFAALAPLLAAVLQQLPRALLPAPDSASAPAPPQWLDVDAAAEYSGLSTRLVTALIKSGRLPALRDGRTWKIRRADIDALQGDSANRATPAPLAQSASSNGGHR